jgi:hypothetical protein
VNRCLYKLRAVRILLALLVLPGFVIRACRAADCESPRASRTSPDHLTDANFSTASTRGPQVAGAGRATAARWPSSVIISWESHNG